MVLPSNSCPLIHPDNNASDFMVEWQNPIYLQGSWEIALHELTFIYPPFSLNGDAKIEYTLEQTETVDISVIYINDRIYAGFVRDETLIVSITENNDKIVVTCAKTPFEIEFKTKKIAMKFGFNERIIRSNDNEIVSPNHFDKDWNIEDSIVSITYDVDKKVDETITFKDNLFLTTIEQLQQYILESCSKIFKEIRLVDGLFQFVLKNNVTNVVFATSLSKSLGLTEQQFVNNERNAFTIQATNKPKLHKLFNQIYLYTNIIEPIIVGDVHVPLLKSVWIENKFEASDVVYISIDHPMYLPISSSCINNIEINIRDDSGKLINFAANTKSSLTVHLRKVNE